MIKDPRVTGNRNPGVKTLILSYYRPGFNLKESSGTQVSKKQSTIFLQIIAGLAKARNNTSVAYNIV